MYIQGVLKRMRKCVQTYKICTYYFMNKQYMKEGIRKKSDWRLRNRKRVTAILVLHFNEESKDNVPRTEVKEYKNGFLGLVMRRANSLREIITVL